MSFGSRSSVLVISLGRFFERKGLRNQSIAISLRLPHPIVLEEKWKRVGQGAAAWLEVRGASMAATSLLYSVETYPRLSILETICYSTVIKLEPYACVRGCPDLRSPAVS